MPPRKRTHRAASAEPARLQADAQQNANEVHVWLRHAWRIRQLVSGCSRPKSSSKGPGPRNPHVAEVADGDVLRHHRRHRRRHHPDHRQVPAVVHRGHPAPGAGDPDPKNLKNHKVPARRLAVIAIALVPLQQGPANGGTWRLSTSMRLTPGSRSTWRKCGGH